MSNNKMSQPTRLKGRVRLLASKIRLLGLYVDLVPLLVTVGQPRG